MPEQSLLRIIKRWRRYEERGSWGRVPLRTRGFYILYKKRPSRRKVYDVIYIGVAGIGKKLRQGIIARLKAHDQNIKDWTHFSFFEVHDNITGDDIRELESLLLSIFRHDSRVRLQNVQKGSRTLTKLRHSRMWPGTRDRSTSDR